MDEERSVPIVFVVHPVAMAPTPGPAKCTFTGDLNLNFQVSQTILGFSTPGDTAAETEYWKTDEQLRSEYVAIRTAMNAVEIKGLPTTTTSAEDAKRGADAMLAKDPKSVVLSITCGKDQVLLTLDNGKGVKYAKRSHEAREHSGCRPIRHDRYCDGEECGEANPLRDRGSGAARSD